MKIAMVALFIGLLMGVFVAYTMESAEKQEPSAGSNVTMIGEKQIIDITAKGGYAPRITLAKADTQTILKVNTKGTFDCSASLTIPSLRYNTILPPSAATEIEVPPQKAGTVLQGLCSMGMYGFKIKFQ